MKKVLAIALALCLVLSLAACGGSGSSAPAASTPAASTPDAGSTPAGEPMGPTLSFKLAENQPDGNPITEGMKMFAELANKYTDGTVTIEVYANAALTDEASSIDQCQAGTLDFTRVNTNSLAPTVDEFGVFAMPYLFTSVEQKYAALDGEAGKMVMDTLGDYNMVGLDYFEAGARCFYTTSKPIEKVEDLNGMKIRVQQTEVAISMVQALGANATPMDYAEVFQGLQTGIVDGAENDFVSYYTSGHYEVAKYYSLDKHMEPPAVLICSQKAWDQMTEAQQEAIVRASHEAAEWQRVAMQEYQDESRAECEKAGCTIIDVDIQSFQDAVSSVYDAYPQYAEIVEKIKAA